MYADSPEAVNTWERPDAILPKTDADARCEGGVVTATLKKASWNVLRFERVKG